MVGNRKAETISHSLLKYLIAHLLEKENHKVEIEADFGDYISDVYSWTTGISYEIQTVKNERADKEKLEKALFHAEINDVIFIYVKDYLPESLLNNLTYIRLRKKIIG